MQGSVRTDMDITFLSGVGTGRASLLKKELGITTVRDLLYHFPYRYIDRTRFYKVAELNSELPLVQLKGTITGYSSEGQGRGRRLSAEFRDDTGTVKLVWFKGAKWVPGSFPAGKEYVIFGKPSVFGGIFNIIHPEIESVEKLAGRISSSIQSQYSLTESLRNNFLTSRVIGKLVGTALGGITAPLPETLPGWMVSKYNLLSYHDAIHQIHFPDSIKESERARYRLRFEELFFIQLNLLRLRANRNRKIKGLIFNKVGDNFNNFYYKNLPFSLTDAQKRVIKEIRKDMGSGSQMNRLLQGDVGSGKTIVALMCMLIACDNGYQSCLMAPTEILANQHFNSISSLLKGMDVEIGLLTGSTKKSERLRIATAIADGSMKILVGTHALIEDNVKLKNLGFVIIDEQHRFGVAQRGKLWKKTPVFPHVLVMTATPIPRTLAMTLYGDLDVSVIDQLPPGRKPIKTMHYYDSAREVVFGFMRKQIAEGRQIYTVYPLIRESEKTDYMALEAGLDAMERAFPPPQYAISVVHGKMPVKNKDLSMNLFKTGQAQIMVATTVIEVGVDIPNASVMVIESAERFGLSQLHQLRGRVGRGGDQSYCILLSPDKLSDEARKRLEIMVSTNDGFEIAEADLQIRGSGDVEGTQQSGIPFDLKIADLAKDGNILEYVRRIADEIIADDPTLEKPDNRVLRGELTRLFQSTQSWSRIS
jgi:ATP-dependent DNA helicase RecG